MSSSTPDKMRNQSESMSSTPTPSEATDTPTN